MRIFHTSDWHIGHRLYNNDRDEEFNLFFDWLINKINEYKIELLIVSGDIFDLAYPSNQALKLYYLTLTKITATCCKNIVIIGGNHDSVSTLNAPKEILKYININIIGGASKNVEDEIIEIKSDGNIKLVVCAVPFLRDKDIREAVAGETYESRVYAIKSGIIKHYENIAEKVKKYKEQNIPVIATGHFYASGSKTTDSEREIHIGNLGEINSNKLPQSIDYYALGHIHRPQIVGGNQNVRYSGSPLPLSFSEKLDEKQIIFIDTTHESFEIKPVKMPVFRKLLKFEGNFNEVVSKIYDHKSENKLTDWCEIKITGEENNPEFKTKFEKLIENLSNIKVLKYKFEFSNNNETIKELFEIGTTLNDLNSKEVFDKLLDKNNISEKSELMNTFNELLEFLNPKNK